MARTALVTGASGFLGRQVLQAFDEEEGWSAIGTGLNRASPPSILKADLSDRDAVLDLLGEVKYAVISLSVLGRGPS